MWHVACGTWHVACGMWHVTLGMWHVESGQWKVECRMSNDEWNVACGMWHVKAVHRLSSLHFSDVCSHRWTHNAYCEQCARFLPLTALHVLTFFTLTALEGADTRPPTHTRAVAVAISPNDPAVCPNGWTRNSYCGECASFPSLTVLLTFSTLFHGTHSVFYSQSVECGSRMLNGMWNVECEGCPASNLLMSVLMAGHTPHTMHTVKNVHPSYQSQLHHSRSLLSQSAGRRRQPTHVSLEVVAILRRPWCLF